MSVIYRKGSFLKIQMADIIFKVAPLTYAVKAEILGVITKNDGMDIVNAGRGTYLLIKNAVKGIEGLFDSDGKEYELSFEKDDTLTDQCIDEILNVENSEKLGWALQGFLKGIPSKLIDPLTGKEMKGVKYVPLKAKSTKK